MVCDRKPEGKVLVVAAHPDDEVLGCGGTIARWAAGSIDVRILILGEGVTSRYSKREQASASEIRDLHARARDVAAFLGAKRIEIQDLPDNRFDTVPFLDIVKRVETAIGADVPDTILTHHSGDLNVDHTITHRAVLTATRPVPENAVREILAFEVPSSTDWAFAAGSGAFAPSVFLDIADTLDRKLQALAMYNSEARPFPHPRSPEALAAVARRWGSIAGLRAAEAFVLIRRVG